MVWMGGTMEPKPEYTVVTKNNLDDLIDEVNRMIEIGWIPTGGIAVKEGADHDHYLQAVIRNLPEQR